MRLRRREDDPDLVIRLPDGGYMTVAMSLTDYALPSDLAGPAQPPHLLDLGGLLRAAQLIDHLRQAERLAVADADRLPCQGLERD